MSNLIKEEDVDIVIAALKPDLTIFLEEWRAIFSPFHLIIVKDPNLDSDLQIPTGFNHHVYTKVDMERTTGYSEFVVSFSGYSCRYFGYLISKKKYVISIDTDCSPAFDNNGQLIDPISQHIVNFETPATPFFFNTLYDPYREGADFVRGYPFSLRTGVKCVLSCGLWLNLADYDAPTQAVKLKERNNRYVDAVMTVPLRTMMPVSGINIGFDREVLGPAMFPTFQLLGDGKQRWETLEDIWCGMCAKTVSDHLGFGVKTGLPYVTRGKRMENNALESLKSDWEKVKLIEMMVPFFDSIRLPRNAITPEDCVIEISKQVREKLGPLNQVFGLAAQAMEHWVNLWKTMACRPLLT